MSQHSSGIAQVLPVIPAVGLALGWSRWKYAEMLNTRTYARVFHYEPIMILRFQIVEPSKNVVIVNLNVSCHDDGKYGVNGTVQICDDIVRLMITNMVIPIGKRIEEHGKRH